MSEHCPWCDAATSSGSTGSGAQALTWHWCNECGAQELLDPADAVHPLEHIMKWQLPEDGHMFGRIVTEYREAEAAKLKLAAREEADGFGMWS